MQDAPDEVNRSAAMLALLAEIGAPKGLVGMLASLAGIGMLAEQRRYLDGPVVIHQSAWMDMVPHWMAQQIAAERAEIVLGGKAWIVGPTEIAAVMMPATYEAPMHREMAELYFWATANACSRHYGKPIAEYWAMLGMPAIADREVIERGGRLWNDYSDLAHEIRRRVVKHSTWRQDPGVKRPIEQPAVLDNAARPLQPERSEDMATTTLDVAPGSRLEAKLEHIAARDRLSVLRNDFAALGHLVFYWHGTGVPAGMGKHCEAFACDHCGGKLFYQAGTAPPPAWSKAKRKPKADGAILFEPRLEAPCDAKRLRDHAVGVASAAKHGTFEIEETM